MAVQLIQSTDTLETGFRHKANSSFNAIIISATPVMVSGQFSGIIRLNCFDGSFINLDLSTLYYTQTQISQILSGFTHSLYLGDWNNAFPGGYPVKAVVSFEGNFWRSNINANADTPGATANWTSLINISLSNIQAPFTGTTGFTINWQTDIVPGKSSTYVAIFGNVYPKPIIYVNNGANKKTLMTGFNLDVNDDGSGNFTTVVFSWDVAQTGFIQF